MGRESVVLDGNGMLIMVLIGAGQHIQNITGRVKTHLSAPHETTAAKSAVARATTRGDEGTQIEEVYRRNQAVQVANGGAWGAGDNCGAFPPDASRKTGRGRTGLQTIT